MGRSRFTNEYVLRGEDRTASAFSSFTNRLNMTERRINRFASSTRRIFGAGLALSVGGALFSLTNSVARYGDSLDKAAIQTGASVQELNQLGFQAEITGSSLNTIINLLPRLSANIGRAADGTGEQSEALDTLGVNIEDVINLRPIEQFRLISERLRETSNASLRNAAASQLFGRSYRELIGLFQASDSEITRLNERLQEVQGNFGERQTRQIAEYKDSVTELNRAWSSFASNFTGISTRLVRGATAVFSAANQARDSIRDSGNTLTTEQRIAADERFIFFESGSFNLRTRPIRLQAPRLRSLTPQAPRLRGGGISPTLRGTSGIGQTIPQFDSYLQGLRAIEQQSQRTAFSFEDNFRDALSSSLADFRSFSDAISNIANQLSRSVLNRIGSILADNIVGTAIGQTVSGSFNSILSPLTPRERGDININNPNFGRSNTLGLSRNQFISDIGSLLGSVLG